MSTPRLYDEFIICLEDDEKKTFKRDKKYI